MLKRMFYLCWTTTLIGVVTGIATWAVLRFLDPGFIFIDDKFSKYELSSLLLGIFSIAFTSIIGFIAFLFGRFYILGILRNRVNVWTGVQIFFIALTLFDLFFVRFKKFAGEGDRALGYLGLPLLILVVGIAITLWKVKLTNRHAIVPTLFFMIVITVLELLPSLSVNRMEYILYMLIPLVVCNAWQILTLHKLVGPQNRAVQG
ncbi:KinB signaling pathway activation protein [Paenibacillus selenitireducens]|uniref:KinB signaling pathway activation protein n=1 Tax=Paenibacillus selenitireducens TaxID=1324314 RepID=A0A1T2XMN2_9BACL|nr:KinB-signaling pathway activation protein [Paenibacillus selenitireducens]OPA81111.1 KinB signaling pathway activation protein [Paenibacillus selenitireducens]